MSVARRRIGGEESVTRYFNIPRWAVGAGWIGLLFRRRVVRKFKTCPPLRGRRFTRVPPADLVTMAFGGLASLLRRRNVLDFFSHVDSS
jgi:hypothetical protein